LRDSYDVPESHPQSSDENSSAHNALGPVFS